MGGARRRVTSLLAVLGLIASLLGVVTALTAAPAGAVTPRDVCYYEVSAGSGIDAQTGPITAGGHTAIDLDDVTAADLAGCDVLVAENENLLGWATEWTASLADIDAAVQAGMKLIVHDWTVTDAASNVPGLAAACTESTTKEIDLLAIDQIHAAGPFGRLDDSSLDDGNESNHGYCAAASLPAGAVPLLSRASDAEVVAFSYPLGSGFVYYATIPQLWYLKGVGANPPRDAFTDVYAPNVVHYVLGLDAPQTFTVDTTTDATDATPGDGVCATAGGQCSLRAAVEEANTGPNADTIVVPAGTYALTLGTLGIVESVTIDGADATIDATAIGDRALLIEGPLGVLDGAGPHVRLSGLTITGGDTEVSPPLFDAGGGLYARGYIHLDAVTVTGNHAGATGGGIALAGPEARLNNVTAVANTTAGDGASGVVIDSISGGVFNSTIAANSGGATTAGLSTSSPEILIRNTVIAANLADGVPADCAKPGMGTLLHTANFIGADVSCGAVHGANGNQVGAPGSPLDAQLAPAVVDPAGVVATLPPLVGSPLVDSGNDAGCLLIDARGVLRPQLGGCDIGAHEVSPPQAPTGIGAFGGVEQLVVGWSAATSLDGPVIDYTVTLSPGGATCTTTGLSCSVGGLTSGQEYTVSVVARNQWGTGPAGEVTATPSPDYVAQAPERILDTRSDLGTAALVGPRQVIELQVAGVGGVPPVGQAEAVVLNVTSTGSDTPSFVTVWPTGEPRPNASNLNTEPGQDTPNLVIAKLGAGGKVSIYNDNGSGHLIADVQGWFPVGSTFNPMTPLRALDTRNGTGVSPAGPLGPLGSIDLTVTGLGPIPSAGVGAVVLNVTSTGSDTPSFATVWPTGVTRPNASNLNTEPGQDTPNLVIAKVGTGGRVSLYNNAGSGHFVADLLGWFPTTSSFEGLTPARLLDTRDGTGVGAVGPMGPASTIELQVIDRGGVPATGVAAVVLNVTSTGSDTPSFITVWPKGSDQPNASNLNTDPGQDTPNLVIAKVGDDGRVLIYNNAGNGHVVADVLGYFES